MQVLPDNIRIHSGLSQCQARRSFWLTVGTAQRKIRVFWKRQPRTGSSRTYLKLLGYLLCREGLLPVLRKGSQINVYSCIQISLEYFLCFLHRRHRAHSGFRWYTGGFRRNGWSSADSGWYNPDILQVWYQKLMHWSRRWKASLSDSQLHDVLLRWEQLRKHPWYLRYPDGHIHSRKSFQNCGARHHCKKYHPVRRYFFRAHLHRRVW